MARRNAPSPAVYSLLLLLSCSTPSSERPQLSSERWELITLGGTRVIPGLSALTAEFLPDGNLNCYGGINWFGCEYQVRGNSISVQFMSTTLMGSSQALVDQEKAFERALERASTFLFESQSILVLRDSDGRDLAAFRKIPR